MKTLSFPGGVHPRYFKDISIREPLRVAPLPNVAVIPLSQHIGAPNEAIVKKGDYLEEGQMLGTSKSYVSSPVHSPVYGTVQDIKKTFHPTLGYTLSVVIQRDESKEPRKYTEHDTEKLSPKEIIEKVRNAGIVGMGGAAFPTHVKLNVPENKKIETLIINGAECEPYLTCDHVLMTRGTGEILKGIEIIIKILQPKYTYIAIEDNKKTAFSAFQKMVNEFARKTQAHIEVVLLKTKYPQGGEKQLIKAISKREVPPGKLPLDIGFLVHNVGTVYAIYEAVCLDKPLIERIITVSGDCLNRPGNYRVRIGTTIKDIVEQHGVELYKDPKKVIIGGPMMGFAQPHMDVSFLKSTSGILFLSDQRAGEFEEEQCIKCAKCVDSCPVRLVPTEIMKNVKKGYWEALEKLYVPDCIECGACVYSCPSRIPLVQYIKQGKSVITRK